MKINTGHWLTRLPKINQMLLSQTEPTLVIGCGKKLLRILATVIGRLPHMYYCLSLVDSSL